MAFFGKKFTKLTEKWIPVAKSVSCYDAKRLAKDIEKESTVSQTDVMAVLNAIPNVMSRYLAEGHSVKLDGIGSFFLTFECKKTGVDTPEEVSMDQVTNIKVQFRPTMKAGVGSQKGKRINTLIADDIEWTYLPGTKDDATDEDAPDTDGGGTDNGGGNNGGGNDFVG
ncbi:MAG: HU family DNA-binding protein [Paludibacteraceae bacterium]|nr:HU family DNA-binding protein [Paludibacteraceae bacterium]